MSLMGTSAVLHENFLQMGTGTIQAEVNCPLVHENLKGAPGFDVCDGVAIIKLTLRCVDTDKR